jgi:tyrosyl-tRNA synthetase
MVIVDDKKLEVLLLRGVEEVIDKDSLAKKLQSGRKLRIKLGIDPTSPNIHLGRSIPLLKLRDFQELGHEVALIIGDFTGVIGDTSDKESERPMLSEKVIKENLKNYIKQAGKIINTRKAKIYYNSKWLRKLDFADIGRQADIFSVNNFISRENIAKRLAEGKRVSLREVLYPLMQGYDSVAIKADVELGGTDQRFNLLAGRDLQREYGQAPQDIVTNPLVEGLDGRKMSSSWGNTVNLSDAPNDMFGKLMSLKDEFIVKYFTLLTRVPLDVIAKYESNLKSGANPRDIKMALAKEIVRMYHGDKEAEAATAYFTSTFTKKETPTDMPEIRLSAYDLTSALIESKAVASKSEARRVLEQNGVKVNQTVVTDGAHVLKSGDIVQKGKIHFFRIK